MLKPSITREPWTEEEDRAILHYQAQLGNRWSQVAKFVPGASFASLLHFMDSFH